MSLGKHFESKVSENGSWWVNKSRAEFNAALEDELPRMQVIGAHVATPFQQPGDTRITRPAQKRREA